MVLLLALAALAAPVSIERGTKDLTFAYRWSAEAQAVPELSRRFRSDAAIRKERMLRLAAEDRILNETAKLHSGGLSFSRTWETSGKSPQLLSLTSTTSAYTGGAHPNSYTNALLWDRRSRRETDLASLLRAGQSWDGAIRQPFCVLLDLERTKRRQEPVEGGEWPSDCPALKELTLVLADTNRNGRFDHLEITANPYTAGPYSEGSYEISLPLTATMLSRLKPAYLASFEPQPPVQ